MFESRQMLNRRAIASQSGPALLRSLGIAGHDLLLAPRPDNVRGVFTLSRRAPGEVVLSVPFSQTLSPFTQSLGMRAAARTVAAASLTATTTEPNPLTVRLSRFEASAAIILGATRLSIMAKMWAARARLNDAATAGDAAPAPLRLSPFERYVAFLPEVEPMSEGGIWARCNDAQTERLLDYYQAIELIAGNLADAAAATGFVTLPELAAVRGAQGEAGSTSSSTTSDEPEVTPAAADAAPAPGPVNEALRDAMHWGLHTARKRTLWLSSHPHSLRGLPVAVPVLAPFADMVNHTSNPQQRNVRIAVNELARCVEVVAIRPVHCGEELLARYEAPPPCVPDVDDAQVSAWAWHMQYGFVPAAASVSLHPQEESPVVDFE